MGFSLGTGGKHVIQPGNWREARDTARELEGEGDAGNLLVQNIENL